MTFWLTVENERVFSSMRQDVDRTPYLKNNSATHRADDVTFQQHGRINKLIVGA